jgi:hypothetical protein
MLEILLDALGGAVAGLLALLAVRSIEPLRNRPRFRAVIVVAAVVLATTIARPFIRTWTGENEVNQLLRTDRLLKRVTRDYPNLFEPLRQTLIQGHAEGGSAQAIAAARELLIPVLPKYLAKGSDETVLRFVRQTVTTLRVMGSSEDPNRCFHYLFPQPGAAVKPTAEEGRDELRAALMAVVDSEGPPADSNGASPQQLLDRIMRRMAETGGADVSILQRIKDPMVDRRKVCSVAGSLYSEALKLPPAEAAVLLRFLFGQ